MSNTQVGIVYQNIIGDVIDVSRVDFEEGGVDEHVLEELRMGWQSKLSQLNVATFPWDPKPEPTPTISNPPTVPSNVMHGGPSGYSAHMNSPITQQQQAPQHQQQHQQQQHQQQQQQYQQTPQNHNMPQMSGQARIKMETGLENNMHNSPSQGPQGLPPNASAADRAQAHLHQSYGPRAAASISAIQGAHGQMPPNQQQMGQQGQLGGQPMTPQQQQAVLHQRFQQEQQRRAALAMQQNQRPGQPPVSAEQYKQQMARQAQGQMQQIAANAQNAQNGQNNQNNQNGQNSLGNAQTDGGGDEFESTTVIKQIGPNGEETMGRLEIDNLLRTKIEAMGTRMEGGGLMLPLKQASTSKSRKIRVKSSRPEGTMAQGDAADDDADVKDEEVDEDAINSDLDDPDDTVNDEDDEGDENGLHPIMLCMYDKVQRVKNKWKCVMKDGVLTINQREYVFHKATGEFEW